MVIEQTFLRVQDLVADFVGREDVSERVNHAVADSQNQEIQVAQNQVVQVHFRPDSFSFESLVILLYLCLAGHYFELLQSQLVYFGILFEWSLIQNS